MSSLRKAVAARLREARSRAGLTQEALSQKLGIESTTLSRYERGEIGISWETLERSAAVLRVPVKSLIAGGGTSVGLRRDEDELVRAYRTLSPAQKRVARWLIPRLRDLK